MENTYGSVHLSFSITCPHCDFYHSTDYEQEWFNEWFPELYFENAENFESEKIECYECGKEFELKKFEY